jgi:outer membrane protein assembly factor BamB
LNVNVKIKMYAAVAALVLVPAPAATAPGDWTQPGYGAGATYYNPDERRLTAAAIGALAQRWTRPTHSSSHCEVGADPVVAGGLVFTTDPGGVGAYDPATGMPQWHVKLRRTTVRGLAFADGKLIALSSGCSVPTPYESRLTAFDPVTGAQLWTIGLAKFGYDLRIDRGVVALDSNQDGVASTIAYRVADGRYLWLRTGAHADGLVSADGRLLLRTAAGAEAVDITTGATLWRTAQDWHAIGTDPDGRRFYVDSPVDEPGLSAVDAATGRVLWTIATHATGVTADGQRIYFTRGRSVECRDAATGRKLFSVHLPGPGGRPVRAGTLLYTAVGTGSPLSIVDAETGTPRATAPRVRIRSDRDHPPVVIYGRLLVTDGAMLRGYEVVPATPGGHQVTGQP